VDVRVACRAVGEADGARVAFLVGDGVAVVGVGVGVGVVARVVTDGAGVVVGATTTCRACVVQPVASAAATRTTAIPRMPHLRAGAYRKVFVTPAC
jgi:hypothetical protein